MKTYAGGSADEMWEAADTMCVLFHETALAVAEQLGFQYDKREAEASLHFFRHVRGLPEDAKEL
jgi:aminoglycoside 6-adenylyltransferase